MYELVRLVVCQRFYKKILKIFPRKWKRPFFEKRNCDFLNCIMWGPIDLICPNCIGKGWAQHPVSYVQTALERAGPNTQSEDKRVSEDDQ